MAVLSDYTSGTISLANGSTAVTGTGTLFDVAKFREGDTLQIENLTAVIASVNSNTSLTLAVPWTGTTLTNAPYRARYLSDGARVTAQATTLIELLGNGVLSNLAEIGVEDGKTPVGNAAGEYELVDTGTLGIQDPNGSLAKLAVLTLGNRQILQTDGSGNLTLLALAARQILQTDADGALKAIALTANKLVNTDANGDILLSDITPYARTLLDDANGAAMWSTLGGAQNLAYSNGYTKLPNGLIIQWGFRAAPPASGSTTFGITYPTGVFGVWAQMASSDANVVASILLNSISTSGFSYLKGYIPRTGGVGGGAGGVDFFFISMGF
ncbi:gp53-like domain-containing protein [Ochrobactrum chromiisoli]|uniref:Putative tail fiber protein gp53-like C-terminal domain-containing protein n=1 Tax=Ochrobactrum chromiisoli TaxID=2993941 RepID=A0ABT3QMA6_9HYPH|nr:hypothetical protein [Ochrobactrum chromiisoli]MCX2696731.1 hypothetical protein [Ochrobactrum chromiisoli]